MTATRQVATVSEDRQVEAAVAVVKKARQRPYRILGGDPVDGG